METKSIEQLLNQNEYPGRGIIVGKSADGKYAVTAYFIMGRSENSRNRVFVEKDGGIKTEAFDTAKLEDPSLIIYAPVRVLDNFTIVTNGDQTDTIFEGLKDGLDFEKSLKKREYEPDAPNFTPRISALINIKDGNFLFTMSILKSEDGNPENILRYTFDYSNPQNGLGRFIHTYKENGNPLPSFEGEPAKIKINGTIDEFTDSLWNNLNKENKVSLFVRFIDIKNGKTESRIVNKNKN